MRCGGQAFHEQTPALEVIEYVWLPVFVVNTVK